MKILNLYAGIGGNRKLWGEHEITAVENVPEIARIYQDFFPNDKVILGDAHQYLLEHYGEFDFIWSSPPCPSHSKIRNEAGVGRGQNKPMFPDMKLYEEIIFLQHMFKLKASGFKGKYVIENVISYYDPLIQPQERARHYFWANFIIPPIKIEGRGHFKSNNELSTMKGFDLTKYTGIDKRAILRNCVEPETGLHILQASKVIGVSSIKQGSQMTLQENLL